MVQAKRLRDAQDWNTRDDRDIMGFTRASFSDHLKANYFFKKDLPNDSNTRTCTVSFFRFLPSQRTSFVQHTPEVDRLIAPLAYMFGFCAKMRGSTFFRSVSEFIVQASNDF
ncbi:hypothetical protein OUZ56_031101 [Daphnia magna]|uniref:Uncharacterized protein n=1 Tax=Daphnia magna TaxID=35525 RepID=A0ABQ9ZT93_9CRUS|nr:hypothetical protein OUZ56_031101 [Daphnia magna]